MWGARGIAHSSVNHGLDRSNNLQAAAHHTRCQTGRISSTCSRSSWPISTKTNDRAPHTHIHVLIQRHYEGIAGVMRHTVSNGWAASCGEMQKPGLSHTMALWASSRTGVLFQSVDMRYPLALRASFV